jgi:hypothetical protein
VTHTLLNYNENKKNMPADRRKIMWGC